MMNFLQTKSNNPKLKWTFPLPDLKHLFEIKNFRTFPSPNSLYRAQRDQGTRKNKKNLSLSQTKQKPFFSNTQKTFPLPNLNSGKRKEQKKRKGKGKKIQWSWNIFQGANKESLATRSSLHKVNEFSSYLSKVWVSGNGPALPIWQCRYEPVSKLSDIENGGTQGSGARVDCITCLQKPYIFAISQIYTILHTIPVEWVCTSLGNRVKVLIFVHHGAVDEVIA